MVFLLIINVFLDSNLSYNKLLTHLLILSHLSPPHLSLAGSRILEQPGFFHGSWVYTDPLSGSNKHIVCVGFCSYFLHTNPNFSNTFPLKLIRLHHLRSDFQIHHNHHRRHPSSSSSICSSALQPSSISIVNINLLRRFGFRRYPGDCDNI
ncbi:hypothetical protein QVD17_32368 [Tagetes erecta]|uniref:Uncharacterized protein n=1 Tax=Tagetes erecta TaxID=13708 RepID=A0AAD8K9I2_TARER|nr:hypothetical protein QVD17_32368 [Tagetes erecta]